MQARRTRDPSRGFTVVEFVIAAAILLITIGLFGFTYLIAKKSSALADERIKALHYARINMETLLTNRYSSASLSVTNRANWMTNYDVLGASTTRFVCSYSVTTSAYTTARIILVTNTWYSTRSRSTNSITMATAVSSGFQW